ncbi:hypothetical protein M9435_006726 [Picochlorum sp. BPE23]|nr:hypothetical protein M9435_006726 [Picochlorum sp. BPE23]
MGNASTKILRRRAGPTKRLDSLNSKVVPEPRQENHEHSAITAKESFNKNPGAKLESRSTTPELPEGDMASRLFGMISSRTETFVSETEKLRQVPSRLINEERKLHRLETRDIRLLMEKVARGDYKDIGSLSREFSNVPEDVLASVIDFATLPEIDRSADGRLVAKRNPN